MLSKIEALNYRSLAYVSQRLEPMHVLVGPNASGKTTFFDVISFLADLVKEGLDFALEKRSSNFEDLLFCRSGDSFELAVEATIPAEIVKSLPWTEEFEKIRYQVSIGRSDSRKMNQFDDIVILDELVSLQTANTQSEEILTLFPRSLTPPSSILTRPGKKGQRGVVRKVPEGNDNFYPETLKQTKGSWSSAFRLGPRRSALGNLPEDETQFPITTWLRRQLTEGLQYLVLDSRKMRLPSAPGRNDSFKTDGANLPFVVERLKSRSPESFDDWIKHIRVALPDIDTVITVERPEDRHRYLIVRYTNGFEAPSWVVSDGTLRLLALTLPAYLPETTGILLIEEPENGIHPMALEVVFQSLSSLYDAQVLLATHSPGLLSLTPAQQILCFARNEFGATDIVTGDRHPLLHKWKGTVDHGTLLASGVLG